MKIDISNKLLEAGLTEELLLFYHSRTANSKFDITKAHISYFSPLTPEGDFRVVITTSGGSKLEYVINVAKIRQKRLNIILGKN